MTLPSQAFILSALSVKEANKATFVFDKEALDFSIKLEKKMREARSVYNKTGDAFYLSVAQYGKLQSQCHINHYNVWCNITIACPTGGHLNVKNSLDRDVFSRLNDNLGPILKHVSNSITQALMFNGVSVFPDVYLDWDHSNKTRIGADVASEKADVTVMVHSSEEVKVFEACSKSFRDLISLGGNENKQYRPHVDDIHFDSISCYHLATLLHYTVKRVVDKAYIVTHNESLSYADSYLNTLQENRGFRQFDIALVYDLMQREESLKNNFTVASASMRMLNLLSDSIRRMDFLPAAYAATALNLLIKLGEVDEKKPIEHKTFEHAEIFIVLLFQVTKAMADVKLELTKVRNRQVINWLSFFHYMQFISYLPPF